MSKTIKVDARGLYCPEPVMLLHKHIRDIEVGDILDVVATDPSTERDVPKFCRFLQHELLEAREENDEFIYRIKKCGDE